LAEAGFNYNSMRGILFTFIGTNPVIAYTLSRDAPHFDIGLFPRRLAPKRE